jgi:hypothetical protein
MNYTSEPKAQPEHLAAAIEIANQLIDKFQPAELSQTLALINQRVAEEWRMRVEKAHAHARELEKIAQPLFPEMQVANTFKS